MRNYGILFLLVFFAAGFALPAPVLAGAPETVREGYAGAGACAGCHSDLVKGWKTTRHAGALETLKKKSQEGLPACVKCHVTGFEKAGGYVDQELTPELSGVQCESCHGPAAAHAANPGNRKDLVAHPGEASCRECHTKGQDPKFDYRTKKKFVHGASR
ncbi:MAG: cytochrome c family protein [Syntrophales bacterium]|nr:cytochrome c family protein [Syntrophales bacterium]